MEPERINPLDAIASAPPLVIRNDSIISQIHRPARPFIRADMLLEVAINPFKDIFNHHSVFLPYQNGPGKFNIISNSANA